MKEIQALFLLPVRHSIVWMTLMGVPFLEGNSQQLQFKVQFSEALATFVFLENLSEKAPTNVFKKAFIKSEFNTEKFSKLIANFDSLQLVYTYGFPEYPHSQKIEGSTISILKRNLIIHRFIIPIIKNRFHPCLIQFLKSGAVSLLT